MQKQIIIDARFQTIGYIETRSDGTQIAIDAHFNTLGYYHPHSNSTLDARFKTVGYGNLLALLIRS